LRNARSQSSAARSGSPPWSAMDIAAISRTAARKMPAASWWRKLRKPGSAAVA
jgi:hypothetical protein